jgi:hypothetical protein
MYTKTTVNIKTDLYSTLTAMKEKDGRPMKWHFDKALTNYLRPGNKTNAEQNKKKPALEHKPVLQEYKDMAKHLSEIVQARLPGIKSDIDKWSDEIRKIIEIDKKPAQELLGIWMYIDQHENGKFRWGDNIRTPGKLRLKKDGLSYYDLIKNEMTRDANRPRSLRDRSLEDSLNDRSWAD